MNTAPHPPPATPGAAPGPVLIEALAVADERGTLAAPGALLLDIAPASLPLILAVGTPDSVRSHEAARSAQLLSRPRCVVIPGLVNAHTHLDLTHIGPQPHDPRQGFVEWINMIRDGRAHGDEAIASSVRRGIELCLAGGTAAVGDIAGAPGGVPNLTPWRTLRESPLAGVAFLEFFAIGRGRERGIGAIRAAVETAAAEHSPHSRMRLGVQPHAPNTVSASAYRFAVELALPRGLPLATHLAETAEEREFIASATGPQRALLERLGAWDDSILGEIGRGTHPVAHLEPALAAAKFTVAHVNDCDDEALEILAGCGASVVYCPRASEYFDAAARFGPHRYRDMLRSGVNVALGTDSLVNLPPSAAQPNSGGMSVLDEMRLLFRRDGTPARTLLQMASTEGARALGLDPGEFAFTQGASPAGVVAVPVNPPASAGECLDAVLTGQGRAEFLCIGSRCGLTEILTNA